MKVATLRSLVAVTLPLLAFCPLQGQTLAQRELISSSKVQVAERAQATNTKCGTSIKFNVDWSTFSDSSTSPDNPNQQSPWAFVANVTDALDSVCGSDEGKAAVKAKIQTVTVVHEKTESEKLTGGTLRYAVPYSGAGVQKIIDYLKANL